MQNEYSIAELYVALRVTRSGYHAWVERAPGVRAQADAALLPLFAQAHRESRQTYGSPRIRIWLQEHGQSCGRQRIGKLMRIAGLNGRRRFRPVSLTDSSHDLPVAPQPAP
jgi:putative transposase